MSVRNKGARTERGIVNALLANGIAAARVPLSGAAGGRFAGDIILSLRCWAVIYASK
jgi:Holliday junction resolvase